MEKEKAEKKKRRRRVRFRRSDVLYTVEDWEAYEQGIRYFNRERFFEAHESWEEVWHRAHEVDKRFLQGLIQAAAFLLKVKQDNANGSRLLYGRAVDKLKAYRQGYWGLKVERLLKELAQVREGMETGEKPETYPQIHLTRKLKELEPSP